MHIIIYDDSIDEASELKEALIYCFKKFDLEVNFTIINDARIDVDLNNCDLIFLDIEIGNQSGLELGKKIRELNYKTPIILTTNFKQYALDGYKIKADRYFLKPINRKELYIELKELLKETIKNSYYYYDDKLSFDKIYFKDILYVESDNKKSYLHILNHRTIMSSKTLKDWTNIFKDFGFCYAQRSCLVNMMNIELYDGKQIKMKNNDILNISRHFKDEFNDNYYKYVIRG